VFVTSKWLVTSFLEGPFSLYKICSCSTIFTITVCSNDISTSLYSCPSIVVGVINSEKRFHCSKEYCDACYSNPSILQKLVACKAFVVVHSLFRVNT
jgi:hypothetical protein